ncbi:MAG TPA: hypothetical protein VHD60_01220 [Candidatus Saccharimonadales bacterium]|nr:hypothetical protein [Candidatus Saccharimonadales bacterium]
MKRMVLPLLGFFASGMVLGYLTVRVVEIMHGAAHTKLFPGWQISTDKPAGSVAFTILFVLVAVLDIAWMLRLTTWISKRALRAKR